MHVAERPGRLLLVGESPGANPPDYPLSAARPSWTGRRMASILGLDWRTYEARVSRMNMSDEPGAPPHQFDGPGTSDSFHVPGGPWTERVSRMLRLSRGRAVVLLGGAVADAVLRRPYAVNWRWYQPDDSLLDPWTGDPVRVTVVPHPSGSSRVYNDPDERRAAHDAIWSEISRAAQISG